MQIKRNIKLLFCFQITFKHRNAETNAVSSLETENIRSPFSRQTSENINTDPNKLVVFYVGYYYYYYYF